MIWSSCLLFSLEKFLESHVIGRKHKQQAEKVERKNAIFKRSIYVKGFDPKLQDLEEKLAFYFTEMEVEVEDVYIDKNSVCLLFYVELKSSVQYSFL